MSVFRRLPLWPLWLLGLVSIGAILLFTTAPGRRLFDRASAGSTVRASPGLTVEQASGGGLVVTSIQSGSEAARAGVAVGDVILTVDGQPVRDADAFARDLEQRSSDAVVLGIEHHHAQHSVTLHLAASPATPNPAA